MSDLPDRWTIATVGAINRFSGRMVDPQSTPGTDYELYSVPIFPTGRPELVRGSEIGSTKQSVEPNDVLVCKINPRINRVWVVGLRQDRPQIASSEWIGVRAPDFDARFLRHYFSSPAFRGLIEEGVTGVGGSLTRAQPKRVATFPVPVAPASEQKRIAEKLDAVLAWVDTCRERLDRVPLILKKFRDSVLEAAVSGRLTANGGKSVRDSEHFDDPPAGWKRVPFVNLIESIRTGTTAVPMDTPTGHPVLRSSSVRPLAVDLADSRYLTKEQSDNDENFLATGDLLFTRLSGSKEFVGNCAMVHAVPARFMQYPDRLFRARLKDPRSGRFMELAFASARVRQQVEAKVKSSAGHQRISTDAITGAILPVPPSATQDEIVRRVGELFALADNLERRFRAAVHRVEKLTPAVLEKAFRGELVPQDPREEPASRLLERIETRQSVGSGRVSKFVLAAERPLSAPRPDGRFRRGSR